MGVGKLPSAPEGLNPERQYEEILSALFFPKTEVPKQVPRSYTYSWTTNPFCCIYTLVLKGRTTVVMGHPHAFLCPCIHLCL